MISNTLGGHSLEKILMGLLILCLIIALIGVGLIFYKAAVGDKDFFSRKVYIVNQDFCKEAK